MRREAGEVRRRAQPVRVDRHQHQRERRAAGSSTPGWRNVRTTDRRAISADLVDEIRFSAPRTPFERAAGLREEDVVEARLVQVDLARRGGSRRRAPGSPSGGRRGRRAARRSAPGRAAVSSPKRPSSSRSRSRSPGDLRARPRPSACRSPPSAARAFPSATMRPWSMIPTRSASTSASSRYCVVRKTVTPSSRARRPTSSQSAVRLCGSRPVVGSSRKRIDGSWISASARSSRRFMPPE